MYSTGKLIVWCIVSAVAALGAVAWVLTANGMSAREPLPGPVDHVLASMRMAAVDAASERMTSPLAGRADAWREGGREFQHDCAMCHGPDGRGHGRIGDHMYPEAPSLAEPDTQEMSDGELYHVIADGIRLTGMPAWAHEKPETIWHFIAFVRHLPQLTPDELREIGGEASGEHEAGEHDRGGPQS